MDVTTKLATFATAPVLAVALAGPASADILVHDFDTSGAAFADMTKVVENVAQYDLNDNGNFLIQGFQPVVGDIFDLYFVTKVDQLSDINGNPLDDLGINQGYEITIIGRLVEKVTAAFDADGGPVDSFPNTATFEVQESYVEIYWEAPPDALKPDGTGFQDGTLIARVNGDKPFSQSSSFTAQDPTTGQGGTQASVQLDLTFNLGALAVNPDFFRPADIFYDITFKGGLVVPQDSPIDQFWNPTTQESPVSVSYDVNNGDILGTFDGFQTYSPLPAIPEPATLVLLGFGLVGLGVAGRKSMKKS